MNKDRINILLTGGSGLVGEAVWREMVFSELFDINKAVRTSTADTDLREWLEVENLFENNKPDYVIHCAGKVGGLGGNMNYKGEFFYDNIMINTNVIEACRLWKVKKLVCFLSTCIFPDKVEYPLTENKIHLGEPHNSNYPYAYAKRMVDIQLRAYREQYGLNYVSIIPTNIYGPYDNFNLENGHVIPSLIHKCYIAKKTNTPFKIWGSGKPLREFIFSKDVGKLTGWVLKNYDDSEPIILSTSEEISIEHVVSLIVKCVGFTGKVVWEKDKPDGQFRKPSSNAKLLSHLPDFEFTGLEKGIEETVNWFNANYKVARK